MARILVVDDDLGTLDTFGAILRHAGHAAFLATTGQEGLFLASLERPDLMITDLRLPDISGLEFLAEVRDRELPSPVVIVTAFGTRAARFASRQLGAVDFIEKPIDEDVILQLVRAHVERQPAITHASIHDTKHAATRWITIVLPVTDLAHDVPTVAAWAREVGHSQATLKRWCSNADVHASDSLDFARALRIVGRYAGHRCRWFDALAIADPSTLVRFMRRAAFSRDSEIPALREFLRHQDFVTMPTLIEALSDALASW